MRIPEEAAAQEQFVRWIIDSCCQSQAERRSLYEKRRRYYLYGQNKNQIVRYNKLKSHLALLRSFIFAEDSCTFSVSAPKNADDKTIAQFLAVEDDWNADFTASGLADQYDEALLWSIVYDTMILKLGWNDVTHSQFAEIVEPASFGVFEEYKDFESQQAMVHSFIIDYDDAVERMLRGGLAHRIHELKEIGGGTSDTGLPGTLNQIVISATGGANVQGNIVGEVNPNYEASPSYAAKVSHTVVAWHEVTVWDSAARDWRYFHVIAPSIIVSDSRKTIDALTRSGKRVKERFASTTNFFLKQEHPFVAITPYRLYNYMWGDCHLEDLIPLQNWLNERLDQINEILEAQVDPAKDFAGFSGMDDERMESWGGPGTYVQDALPGAKATLHYPQMPPDLFSEFSVISDVLFLEQSGFTETLAGRGEKNVRGKGHAQQLQTTGGGAIRKVATGLEKSLTRLADKGLKLKAKNDDTKLKVPGGEEFVIEQIVSGSDYSITVNGHSHSPLFTATSNELALTLFKAHAIDREWLIRMTNPPHQSDLLHSLRKMVIAENQARQQALQARIANPHTPGRKPNGAAVEA